MLLTTAVALDSNVQLGKINPCLLLGMKKNILQLMFRATLLGIPDFYLRILSWGSSTSAWE